MDDTQRTKISRGEHNPLFHIVKRDEMPRAKAWMVRGIAIVLSFIFMAIIK